MKVKVQNILKDLYQQDLVVREKKYYVTSICFESGNIDKISENHRKKRTAHTDKFFWNFRELECLMLVYQDMVQRYLLKKSTKYQAEGEASGMQYKAKKCIINLEGIPIFKGKKKRKR